MKKYSRLQGFSLIEVVLALGIISIALVAIIGLVSTSLNSSKDSKDDTAIALMTQTVTAQLREKDYRVVTNDSAFSNASYNGNKISYYFDSSGNLSRDSSGVAVTDPAMATSVPLYSCTITVKQPPNYAFTTDKDGKEIAIDNTQGGWAVIKLDFAWPYNVKTQHKTIFTSLAKYDDF